MNKKIAIIGLMLILGMIAISGCLQASDQNGTQGNGTTGQDETAGIPTPTSPEGTGSDADIPNLPI